MKKSVVAGVVCVVAMGSTTALANSQENNLPELTSDVQLESMFEADQNRQLAADQQYMVSESVQEERNLQSQKTRVKVLQAKNQMLNEKIRRHAAEVRNRAIEVRREEALVRSLERQVAAREMALERLRTQDMELRKRLAVAHQKVKKLRPALVDARIVSTSAANF